MKVVKLLWSLNEGSKKVCQKYFKNIPNDYMDNLFTIIQKKLVQLAGRSMKYRNVICHGDIWGNNILYKYKNDKPIEAVLVDFQLFRIAPPALDLAKYLYTGINKEFREKYYQQLKDIYYNHLNNIFTSKDIDIDNFLSKDELEQTLINYRDFGIAMGLYYIYVTKLPPKYIKPVLNDPKKFLTLMTKSNAEFTMNAYENDSNYRKSFIEAFEEVLKHFGNGEKFNLSNYL